MAGANAKYAVLRSPMKAIVANVPVEVGQMVMPGQSVMTLVDLTRVKLVLGVVERKLPLLRKGQRVQVEIQALAAQAAIVGDAKELTKPREGLVTIVPPAANSVTGLFNVEIELPNPESLLRAGMVGRAIVTVMERRALAVPADAVVRSGDKYLAFFVARGYNAGLDLGGLGKAAVTAPTTIARRVAIEPVSIDKDVYLVTGVPEGLDELIVEGQSRLSDGQPVTVVGDIPRPE
jgi:multidrug efflux pump subunit AcrA (membrane-fusion protein)